MKQDGHAMKQNNYKADDPESFFLTTTNCPPTNSCKASVLGCYVGLIQIRSYLFYFLGLKNSQVLTLFIFTSAFGYYAFPSAFTVQ